MDVFSRIYHIIRAKTAPPDYSDFQASEGFGGGARAYADFASQPEPPSAPERDPVLAGYYANLELPYGADLGAVKAAWKRLMKKYHPDRHAQDPNKRQVANELCAELTRAYQELERALSGPPNG